MKNIVVVDIDGTLSKVGDRLKYLKQEPVDWDRFYDSCFEDEPIPEIINLVKSISHKYQIVYCTGRRESVREITKKWLARHMYGNDFLMLNDFLIMRPDGDNRHDIHVKPEQLMKAGWDLKRVAFVLEDRDSMVKKWRELGVKCLQVAEGDF